MKKWLLSLFLILLAVTPCFSEGVGIGMIGSKSFLYQATDCSTYTWEGAMCWDTDDDKLYVGDGATALEFAPTVSPSLSGDVTINATLGTNTAPAMADAGWTHDGNWVLAGGVATHSATSAGTLLQGAGLRA